MFVLKEACAKGIYDQKQEVVAKAHLGVAYNNAITSPEKGQPLKKTYALTSRWVGAINAPF